MKRCGLFGRATILLLLTTAPALADIIGSARVIDGDTMAIGKIRIRLYGIDAPEAKQSCLSPSTRSTSAELRQPKSCAASRAIRKCGASRRTRTDTAASWRSVGPGQSI